LALGSNINSEENIRAALKMLAAATHLVSVSSIWKTKPVGLLAQADFLNGAALIMTPLSAAEIKATLIGPIEQALQRIRQADKNGPRTIDLDIVLFNQQILEVVGNHIPDPDIYKRPFLALPLAEISPDYEHPETGDTLQQIADKFGSEARDMVLLPEFSRELSISINTIYAFQDPKGFQA